MLLKKYVESCRQGNLIPAMFVRKITRVMTSIKTQVRRLSRKTRCYRNNFIALHVDARMQRYNKMRDRENKAVM